MEYNWSQRIMPPKLRIFERKHIPLRHIERDLLVGKAVTARPPPQLHRLEEEAHCYSKNNIGRAHQHTIQSLSCSRD